MMKQDDLIRLSGTLACDEEGRPLVLHHGTFERFGRFERTEDIGFHFGSRGQAMRRRQDKARETRTRNREWRVMKVALAASKVVVFPDDPRSFTNWPAVHGLASRVDPDFLPRIKRAGVSDSAEAARQLRELMVGMGYDAVVYRNMHESDAGSVAEWSWIALHSEAVVIMPDDFEGETLAEAVGCAPGLDLPRNARDIPGARNRNGSIRFVSDRRSLVAEIGKMAVELGGEMDSSACPGPKEHQGTFPFRVPFAGGEAFCEMLPEIGRIRMVLPEEHRHVMGEVVDDFVSYTGLSRGTACYLVYEWQEGEALGDFVSRIRGEIEKMRNLARHPSVGLQVSV